MQPEIVTGARSTIDSEPVEDLPIDHDMISVSAKKLGPPPPDGEGPTSRRFAAVYPGLAVSVRHRHPRMTIDGMTVPDERDNQWVRFGTDRSAEPIVETKDPVVIKAIEKFRGYGMEVYDLDQWEKNVDDAHRAAIKESFLSDPTLVDEIKAEMAAELKPNRKAEDFPAPGMDKMAAARAAKAAKAKARKEAEAEQPFEDNIATAQ